MILVDKEIRSLANGNRLITPFCDEKLTNIGYDLTSKDFTNAKGQNYNSYELVPGESIFVRAEEGINMPEYLAARVILRNSRIRQGLSIDSPLYQPGHSTAVFFRVTNVSKATITLKSGDGLATIVFEKLSDIPEQPYQGTFQKEFDYSGMGKYGAEYSEQIKEVENKMADLKNIEKTLYGNVITLMTIFIGIFSLININMAAIGTGTWDLIQLVGYNLAIIGGISTLTGLIRVVVPVLSHDAKQPLPKWYWLIPTISFAVSVLLTLIP